LLNAAEVAEVTLTETNDKIEIDADTRTMIIPNTERIFGVMSDEKGERKYFRCKRFVGNGIDLSKLSLRIVFQNASGLDTGKDKYIVTDLATDGEDYVTFSWELSRKVTAYKGIISFIVCAIKTNSDGTITNEWNTTLANGIVLEGLEANGTQEQEQVARDYYNQLEAELLRVANEQKTEIEKKAQEVIGTIPSDYTQMQKDVNGLKEDIGDLKNILDEFPINFTRGYHVTYVSNGVTKVKESSDTASSAYQQRVKSPSYDKGVIPVGSSVICKGLATARVWFVTYENTLIGYTEFVKEYTIPETYNGSSYDRIYIDAKNNDSSVMETNYAKKNIRVVGEKNIQDRLANVEEEAEKAIKYITPSKKRCWTIHNQEDMYVLENGDKTPVKAYLDKETTPSGTMYVNNGRTVYRNAVTSPLFEKLTWLVSIGTVGDFAFGTKDVNGGGYGVKCVISPSNKTIKIYHSDWDGTDNIKRNLTFDFVISANEKYLLEISKDGLYSISFCFSCITDTAKTFKYEHIADSAQLTNKIRAWGGVAFQSLGGQFRLWEMSQKTLVDEYFNLLLIGDSFIEVASTLIPSNAGFAYLVRKELGTKCSASGRGGATTSELLQRIKTDGDVGKYKFVFLQIGANDSISETITVDIFKKNLLNIIDYFIERGVEPVLTTIPIRTDSDNTNFITKVNPWIKSLGYKFVDEYNIVRGENVLSDGIHLSKNGNTCIFNSIKGVIPEVFS
jgi:lysophospholipase L1-like esterase